MHAGSQPSRPVAAEGSERLRLGAALLAAREEIREIGARLRRAEMELERAREDLEAEREDRARDAEWFRDALAQLRSEAEEALESDRTSEELRSALEDAHEAIAARDTLVAELRSELEMRVKAESETLTALDALRRRATSLKSEDPPAPATPAPPAAAERPPPAERAEPAETPAATEPPRPPATPAAPAPAPAAEAPSPIPGARFERRPPWPAGATELPRAEIEWHAGYVTSYFRVVVYHPNRRRGSTVASGSSFKWLLMGEPELGAPEFVAEVQRLAAALEDAGWEPVGEGAAWFSRRYVWRRDEPPPEQLMLDPLETSAPRGA